MAKTKLLDVENVLVSFKAIVTSIITSLALIIPLGIAYWLINQHNIIILGRVIQILTGLSYLWVWGYFARELWKWK